jgi:hypothetical protein
MGSLQARKSASYEVNPAYTPVEVFITERCA